MRFTIGSNHDHLLYYFLEMRVGILRKTLVKMLRKILSPLMEILLVIIGLSASTDLMIFYRIALEVK